MPKGKTRYNRPLTPEEYAGADGRQCPYCMSSDIEGDSIKFDFKGLTQRVVCLVCDSIWFDRYVLTGYEES
jgi:hypothetical protein